MMKQSNHGLVNRELEFVREVKFYKSEDKQKLLALIQSALQNNQIIKAEELKSLALNYRNTDKISKILQRKVDFSEIDNLISKEPVEIALSNGEFINFDQYQTDGQTILTTNINGVIDTALYLSEDSDLIKFTYKLHILDETNCQKIKTSLESFLILINLIFPEKNSESSSTLKTFYSFFKEIYLYFYLLVYLENKLKIKFQYSDRIDYKYYLKNVIELYVFLELNKPILSDTFIEDLNSVCTNLYSIEDDINIGDVITLEGLTRREYSLYGQTFTINFYNLLFNCLVEDFKEDDKSGLSITYNSKENILLTYLGQLDKFDPKFLEEITEEEIEYFRNAHTISYYYDLLMNEIVCKMLNN